MKEKKFYVVRIWEVTWVEQDFESGEEFNQFNPSIKDVLEACEGLNPTHNLVSVGE